MGLDLEYLEKVSVERTENHCTPLDSWSNSDWCVAIAEEAGEVCGAVKKLKRMKDGVNFAKDPQTEEEYIDKIAEEMGDTIEYIVLLAAKLNINLSKAIQKKFNHVSTDRFKCDILITDDKVAPLE